MDGFKSMYKHFAIDVVPLFANTIIDIQTKITEFKQMNGIEEFLSLGALYAQYIPLNAILNQRISIQYERLSDLVAQSKRDSSSERIISKFFF